MAARRQPEQRHRSTAAPLAPRAWRSAAPEALPGSQPGHETLTAARYDPPNATPGAPPARHKGDSLATGERSFCRMVDGAAMWMQQARPEIDRLVQADAVLASLPRTVSGHRVADPAQQHRFVPDGAGPPQWSFLHTQASTW